MFSVCEMKGHLYISISNSIAQGTYWKQVHSIGRRYMSPSLSTSYIIEIELYLDLNIRVLQEKIKLYYASNNFHDLKEILHYSTVDLFTFSQSFAVQICQAMVR